MSDCVSSTVLSLSVSLFGTQKLGLLLENSNWTSTPGPFSRFGSVNYPKLSASRASDSSFASHTAKKSPNSGPQDHKFYRELEFKEEKRDDHFHLEASPPKERVVTGETGGGGTIGSLPEAEERFPTEGSGGRGSGDVEVEKGLVEINGEINMRKRKQIVKRSNIVAKQVISIQSALSLGFISQLWVDTTAWVVMVVEVRPNLLSGESERFLLEDICQVGDVVLVENENVMENQLKMLGLETLVGYEVVTPGRRTIGKVRGYSFNINSGTVEALELDSFGISIIPSSLVSTYALFVEDVLEVASDRVVVHEAAASHIQRLTKGFWNDQNVRKSINEDELYEFGKPVRSANNRKTRGRGFSGRKFESRVEETEDDWDLPMDFS